MPTAKRHSRLVFVDMGASLDFHGNTLSPAIYINSIYKKFGFRFDQVQRYVFEQVPKDLQAAWHWINVGVDPTPDAKMDPLSLIVDNFGLDDFIVVKLDIDTSTIENQLVHQLRDDPNLLKLVDQFYFEYHVHQKELAPYWGGEYEGICQDVS